MYYQYRFGGRLTEMVRIILAINVFAFLIELIVGPEIFLNLGLIPAKVLSDFTFWQFFTYMFLHAGLMHITFNMLVLWMFGGELEYLWGSHKFIAYYFMTGVGAGILAVIFSPNSFVPIVGASGAIYGLLLAYGMLFPEREIYLYFLFPIKAKHFVILLAGIEILVAFSFTQNGIANFAHLGGMLFGYLYLKSENRLAVWMARISRKK